MITVSKTHVYARETVELIPRSGRFSISTTKNIKNVKEMMLQHNRAHMRQRVFPSSFVLLWGIFWAWDASFVPIKLNSLQRHYLEQVVLDIVNKQVLLLHQIASTNHSIHQISSFLYLKIKFLMNALKKMRWRGEGSTKRC